jgi:hypothetical protein
MCELKKVGISEQRTNYLLVKKERKPTNLRPGVDDES